MNVQPKPAKFTRHPGVSKRSNKTVVNSGIWSEQQVLDLVISRHANTENKQSTALHNNTTDYHMHTHRTHTHTRTHMHTHTHTHHTHTHTHSHILHTIRFLLLLEILVLSFFQFDLQLFNLLLILPQKCIFRVFVYFGFVLNALSTICISEKLGHSNHMDNGTAL